jgi:hypothetical protein
LAPTIGTVAGLGYQFTLPLDRGPAPPSSKKQTGFIGREAALVEHETLLKGTGC